MYSASEVAIEEFPDLDVTVRGAISIPIHDLRSRLGEIPDGSEVVETDYSKV